MKRWGLVFLVIFFFTLPAFAQQVDTAWVRRYNGTGNNTDFAKAIVVDNSGNVYVTGYSYGIGTSHDYLTIKYYSDGDTAWVRRYNGPGYGSDTAQAIVVDNLGNVYVTGVSYGAGTSGDYATVKYGPDGTELWVRRYNGPGNDHDRAEGIAVDGFGVVYVTGISVGIGTQGDYATVRYGPDGTELWVRRYNGSGNWWDGAKAITLDHFGNVYVTGTALENVTSNDYITIKYYPNGNTAWIRRFNGAANSDDRGVAIRADVFDNIYVAGGSYNFGTSWDCATVKYDQYGNWLWTQVYTEPGFSDEGLSDMTVDGSGNVYIAGWSRVTGTGTDYFTIKYYPSGVRAWMKRYNGPGNSDDGASAITLDGSNNVYVTGESYDSVTLLDYTTIKYYPNGDTAWVRRYNGPENGYDGARDIAVDSRDNVYVTGESQSSNYDYLTIKYWQDFNFPSVIAVDSSKFFCGPDTIRFTVIATDPDPLDSVTLSGPGIPTPVKGVSPLSVEAKIYVSATGTNDYVYTVSDGRLTDSDTATWSVTINTAPVVASADSSKVYCGPDTIRFTVTATDPNLGDSLTLSGPGILSPITGLSPLSANIKIHVSATGTYNYIYNVTDKCGASDDDTATYAITINTLPSAFSLVAPVDSSLFVPFLANFDWADAVDPDTGTSLKYTLYVSTSPNFHPDSTSTHSNLTVSQYNDTLGIARYWWKGRVSDGCGFVWSSQIWTLLSAKRGDANADKQLTVSDVVYLINYLFKGGQKPIPEVIIGDANCDKQVTVSDVVYLINYLFKGGPPPC